MRANWFQPLFAPLLVIAAVGSPGWAAETVPLDVMDEIVRSSVFLRVDRVFKYEGFPTSGTGFFIHPDGYILTNRHVVADQIEGFLWGREREISAKVIKLAAVVESGQVGEREMPVKIVALNREHDLALLKVNYRPEVWMDIDPIDDVRLGETIWSAGFPFGDLLALNKQVDPEDYPNPVVSLATGMVTSLRRDAEGLLTMVQTNAALNPGSSGSAVVNSEGHLVGVVVARISGSEGIGFVVSPNRIREFLSLQSIHVEIAPRVVLSPPQPIEVVLRPVLVDLESDAGTVSLDGSDIDETTVELSSCEEGLSALIDFPERTPGRNRPLRYTLTVSLSTRISGERFKRVYHLDVVPESFEKLSSNRDPGEMMEDRQFLAHELAIKDFNRGQRIAQGVGKKSLADLAKEMKLQTDENGDVVLDNQTVGEVGGTKLDPSRYRFLRDDSVRSLAQKYDRLVAHIKVLQARLTDYRKNRDYAHRRVYGQQINQFTREKREIANQLTAYSVRKCNDRFVYFVANGDKDFYPCRYYSRVY